MPTKSKSTVKVRAAAQRVEAKKTDRIRTKVREQVIALLGKPGNLYRLDICLYQGGRARVNIWQRQMVRPKKQKGFLSEPDLVERTHITDSHYLRLSKSAIIESADPLIERRYPD